MHAELRETRPSGRKEDATPPGLRILRFPAVVNRTGLSKSAIYQRIRSDEFPSPVSLGVRAVGFVECEVDGWIEHLIGRSRNHLVEKSNAL